MSIIFYAKQAALWPFLVFPRWNCVYYFQCKTGKTVVFFVFLYVFYAEQPESWSFLVFSRLVQLRLDLERIMCNFGNFLPYRGVALLSTPLERNRCF